jgi:hypothetical protein
MRYSAGPVAAKQERMHGLRQAVAGIQEQKEHLPDDLAGGCAGHGGFCNPGRHCIPRRGSRLCYCRTLDPRVRDCGAEGYPLEVPSLWEMVCCDLYVQHGVFGEKVRSLRTSEMGGCKEQHQELRKSFSNSDC